MYANNNLAMLNLYVKRYKFFVSAEYIIDIF